jgi:hypothetical protein
VWAPVAEGGESSLTARGGASSCSGSGSPSAKGARSQPKLREPKRSLRSLDPPPGFTQVRFRRDRVSPTGD